MTHNHENQPAAEGCGFNSLTANEWIRRASERKTPAMLWSSLWHEGELACLFADTNMGKSIYAVQIADAVSRTGRTVLYLDFEMSDKQFQRRYTDDDSGEFYNFAPTLHRLEYNSESDIDELPMLVAALEREIVMLKADALIVDNITWLCNRSECGDAAGELMMMLTGLKRKYSLSILVLAHTPKRDINTPLTQNSLAGSKRLANFMDSMFAIGLDCGNPERGRYVKQIKVRSAEMMYGESSVICCEVVKEGPMLQLQQTGVATESEMLMNPDKAKMDEHKRQLIAELHRKGLTQREIRTRVRCRATLVSEVINNIDD